MSGSIFAQNLEKAQRIVVKVGSSLLIDEDNDCLNHGWLKSFVADIAHYQQAGKQMLVICSGAIALGRRQLGLQTAKASMRLDEKQAAAAVGQILLNHAWQEEFAEHHIDVAQILLTYDDTETRRRHLNARNTLLQLLKFRVVPIINENDTVATEEIRYGDNDRLAARVAVMMESELLVLLSDIDGLYQKNPHHHDNPCHLPIIKDITPEIINMAKGGTAAEKTLKGVTADNRKSDGTGGMVTKIDAARLAVAGGCQMIISDGHAHHPLTNIAGKKISLFESRIKPQTARKQWIASALDVKGTLIIDDGAKNALQKGKSLLAAGVTATRGAFKRGALVVIHDKQHYEVGRGFISYNSKDAKKILGSHSDDFEKLIGYQGPITMMHRDNLALRETKK